MCDPKMPMSRLKLVEEFSDRTNSSVFLVLYSLANPFLGACLCRGV